MKMDRGIQYPYFSNVLLHEPGGDAPRQASFTSLIASDDASPVSVAAARLDCDRVRIRLAEIWRAVVALSSSFPPGSHPPRAPLEDVGSAALGVAVASARTGAGLLFDVGLRGLIRVVVGSSGPSESILLCLFRYSLILRFQPTNGTITLTS